MFVRRLVLSLFLGAVVAGLSVSAAGAGGFKGTIDFGPVPPVLNDTLTFNCEVHLNFAKQTTELNCEATENPNPPKDRTTVKFNNFEGIKGSCKLTAYPDGDVLLNCRFKGLVD